MTAAPPSRAAETARRAGAGRECARACGTASPHALTIGMRSLRNMSAAKSSRSARGCAATRRCATRSTQPRTPPQNSSTASTWLASHRRVRACITLCIVSASSRCSPARAPATGEPASHATDVHTRCVACWAQTEASATDSMPFRAGSPACEAPGCIFWQLPACKPYKVNKRVQGIFCQEHLSRQKQGQLAYGARNRRLDRPQALKGMVCHLCLGLWLSRSPQSLQSMPGRLPSEQQNKRPSLLGRVAGAHNQRPYPAGWRSRTGPGPRRRPGQALRHPAQPGCRRAPVQPHAIKPQASCAASAMVGLSQEPHQHRGRNDPVQRRTSPIACCMCLLLGCIVGSVLRKWGSSCSAAPASSAPLRPLPTALVMNRSRTFPSRHVCRAHSVWAAQLRAQPPCMALSPAMHTNGHGCACSASTAASPGGLQPAFHMHTCAGAVAANMRGSRYRGHVQPPVSSRSLVACAPA